ncbi:MAG: uridine diphosphate-N-acetylglucosamine-binding protein YvcK [Actinomycetota bacterium]
MSAVRAQPRIVCVGGGHGLSAALRAARMLTPNVTAVVTVADDGGSSGVLRAHLGIPAPGDLRMAIAALVADEAREALLQYRPPTDGDLNGHPLGNLLIAALAELRGDFAAAVTEVAQLAGAEGVVLPSTIASVALRAHTGGCEVRGQAAIAKTQGPVERIWMEPEADVYSEAADALAAADLVVLGPGSLFTSVVAALLPRGAAEAATKADRVAFVMNVSEQHGETLHLDAAGHVAGLHSHFPGLRLDAVLVHEGPEVDAPRPVGVDDDALAAVRAPVVRGDLAGPGGTHEPAKLAAMLKGLLW